MKTKTPRQINAEREAKGLPPLNFALLGKVLKKIEATPKAYDQADTFRHDTNAPCGTAACIGGWADLLSRNIKDFRKVGKVDLNRAADALGLAGQTWTSNENVERSVLFSGGPAWRWPEPYCSQWERAKSDKQRARVAVRYLTRIIKTGKVLE